jgi:hypothetical protein
VFGVSVFVIIYQKYKNILKFVVKLWTMYVYPDLLTLLGCKEQNNQLMSYCRRLELLLSCGEHISEFLGCVEGWNKCWAVVNTVVNVGLHTS